MNPEQTKQLQDWARSELVRLTKTVDEVLAGSANSFALDGAYRGALVQTLAMIELGKSK